MNGVASVKHEIKINFFSLGHSLQQPEVFARALDAENLPGSAEYVKKDLPLALIGNKLGFTVPGGTFFIENLPITMGEMDVLRGKIIRGGGEASLLPLTHTMMLYSSGANS